MTIPKVRTIYWQLMQQNPNWIRRSTFCSDRMSGMEHSTSSPTPTDNADFANLTNTHICALWEEVGAEHQREPTHWRGEHDLSPILGGFFVSRQVPDVAINCTNSYWLQFRYGILKGVSNKGECLFHTFFFKYSHLLIYIYIYIDKKSIYISMNCCPCKCTVIIPLAFANKCSFAMTPVTLQMRTKLQVLLLWLNNLVI